MENALAFAFTQLLLTLPIMYLNDKYYKVGFKTLLPTWTSSTGISTSVPSRRTLAVLGARSMSRVMASPGPLCTSTTNIIRWALRPSSTARPIWTP